MKIKIKEIRNYYFKHVTKQQNRREAVEKNGIEYKAQNQETWMAYRNVCGYK